MWNGKGCYCIMVMVGMQSCKGWYCRMVKGGVVEMVMGVY